MKSICRESSETERGCLTRWIDVTMMKGGPVQDGLGPGNDAHDATIF